MPNFQRSKIYAIRSPSTDAVYVGSTTLQYLSSRLCNHRALYKTFWEGLSPWCSSYALLGYGDAYIELIEDYPCKSIDQLRKRENEVIKATANCCNSLAPFCEVNEIENSQYRANMAWRKRNREKVREWNREGQRRYREKLRAKKLTEKLSVPQV